MSPGKCKAISHARCQKGCLAHRLWPDKLQYLGLGIDSSRVSGILLVSNNCQLEEQSIVCPLQQCQLRGATIHESRECKSTSHASCQPGLQCTCTQCVAKEAAVPGHRHCQLVCRRHPFGLDWLKAGSPNAQLHEPALPSRGVEHCVSLQKCQLRCATILH